MKILLWLLSFHLTKYNQSNWILELIIINTLLDMHVFCSIRTTWLYVQGNVAVRLSHSTRGLGQVSGVEELQTSFHSLSWKRAKTHCKDRISQGINICLNWTYFIDKYTKGLVTSSCSWKISPMISWERFFNGNICLACLM